MTQAEPHKSGEITNILKSKSYVASKSRCVRVVRDFANTIPMIARKHDSHCTVEKAGRGKDTSAKWRWKRHWKGPGHYHGDDQADDAAVSRIAAFLVSLGSLGPSGFTSASLPI